MFSVFFIFKEESVTEDITINEEKTIEFKGENIKSYIDSCLEKVTENGLLLIGRQGGYYQSPLDYSILFFDDNLPYYYYEDEMIILGVEDAEKELEHYIKDNMPLCVDHFKTFEKSGYDVTAGKIIVNVDYGQKTNVNLNYPLKFELGDSVTEMETFTNIVNLNVKKFLEAAKELVEQNLEDKGYICLTCMEDTAKSKEILIDALPIHDTSVFANDIIMFRLEDKKPTTFSRKNFTFDFIMEYLEVEEIEYLKIEDLGTFEINAGELFEYLVKSNKENVSYTDNTGLFNIKFDGMIGFSPKKDQRGTHFVTITAEDESGDKDNELVIIKVI
jgi:hypothetical protein